MTSTKGPSAPAAASRGERGAVLVEGLLALGPLVLALFLQLEIVRRARVEVALRHAGFLYNRARALGAGERRSREKLAGFLGAAFGERFSRHVHTEAERDGGGVVTRVRYRYPSFLSFPYSGGTKHHFELVRRCRFPYSSAF